MIWCYGFVQRTMSVSPEEEYPELLLCEIYFNEKGEPLFYNPVDWDDIRETKDQKLIFKDIKAQMNNNAYWFKDEDFPYED